MSPTAPITLLIPLLSEPPDLSALQDPASWKVVKENAGRYGVAAMVAYTARPHVSPAERVWCDRVLTDNWTRHVRMLGHLEYVLGLLDGDGIRTIALKGSLLAQRYYLPPLLRKPAMDLDVAVEERNLANACNVLIRAGFQQDMATPEAVVRSHHVTFSHRSRPRVELHFRLSHSAMGIPVDEFFERTVPCPLPNGQVAQVLGPADQLLHLVLHLAQSRFGTLSHLCEIRRVCHAVPLAVRAEATRMAVDHRFCGALRMLDIAFRVRFGEPFLLSGAAVPETWLNWRLTENLYDSFERWSTPGRGLSLAARLWGRWLDFQITDRPYDAIRSAVLFTRVARFQFTRHAWGTHKNVVYAPSYLEHLVEPAAPTPQPTGMCPRDPANEVFASSPEIR